MHANRATNVAMIAGLTVWGLLAATAGAQQAAQPRGDGDTAWRRAAPTRDNRDRFYDDQHPDTGYDRRPAPPSQPAPRQDQARRPVDDRDEDEVPPPPLRGTNTANPRPRDTRDWQPRNGSSGAHSTEHAHNHRVEAPRNDRAAQPREPARTNGRDNVRQVQYQSEPSKPAPTREQPYEWHPGRDQAPRAKPSAMTEAPAFDPNTAAPKYEPTLAPPMDRRGMAPPPEYRADERAPNYRDDARRSAASNPRPARDRAGEPIFMAQNQRRGQYRPASANAYELPPGSAPAPQPEIIQGAPRTGGQPIYQGQPVYDGATGAFDVDGNGYPADGYGYSDGYDDGYGPDGYPHSGECFQNCPGPCDYCSTCCGGPSCPHRWFEEANLFAGVHSFQGGLDQGQSGNFGFQEGLNFAGSLWHRYNIGYQVGGMAVQSNLSGSNVQQLRTDSRSQAFVTAGIFRRAICNLGFQGGAVFDWLDDRYYSNSQFAQLRAELSYLWPHGHEFGFWGAFNTGQTQTQVINGLTTQFAATDLYTLFYRKTVAEGGQARVWGGATGNGDGLFGADFRIPMTNRWDFVGGFNYLIPKDGPGSGAVNQQAWGISLNIVWYPTRRACGTHNTPFRQLFTVADNNVFMIRQQ